jgi:hypothetical protein
LSDADGMGDELIAGAAHLVGMAVAGKIEGARQGGAVDRRHRDGSATIRPGVAHRRRIELLDHSEQIGEKLSLL